jgi:hypothetical protein
MGATMAAFDLAAHIERSRGPGLVWAYERQQLHALTAEDGIAEVTLTRTAPSRPEYGPHDK